MRTKSCSLRSVIASLVLMMVLLFPVSSGLAQQPAATSDLTFAWAKTWNHKFWFNDSSVDARDYGVGIIPATAGVEVFGYAEVLDPWSNLKATPFITNFAPNGSQLSDSLFLFFSGRLDGVAETGDMRYLRGHPDYNQWLTFYENSTYGFPQTIATGSAMGAGEYVLWLTAHDGYAYILTDRYYITRTTLYGSIQKWTHEIHLQKYERVTSGNLPHLAQVWDKVLTPEVGGILESDDTGLYVLGGPVFDYDINVPPNTTAPKSITKFDFDGNLIWNMSLGQNTATQEFTYNSLAVESDGLYLAGVTQATYPDNSKGAWDILVTKLDMTGNVVWSNSFDAGAQGLNKWTPVIDKGTTGIYVAANLTTSNAPPHDTNLVVLKLGFNGSQLATAQWCQANDEKMQDAVAVGDAFYITGFTQSGSPPGGSDAFLVKYHGSNFPPIVFAGGLYSGGEGSTISLNAATASDPDGDSLNLNWSVDSNLCTFSDTTILNPDIVCDDQGAYSVTLTADDGIYGPVSSTADLTVNNVAPTGTFTSPIEVNEGDEIHLSLIDQIDPSSADTSAGFQYAFDCGDGDGFGSFDAANSVVCPTKDNGLRTVKGRIQDQDGGVTEYSAHVSINNVAPSVGPISLNQALVEVGTIVNASAVFTDPGILDTHVADWYWGDGTVDNKDPVTHLTSESHAYPTAGIYTIRLDVRDKDGDVGSSTYEFVVVYDPNSGFVTGSGWIDSPAGAYKPDPSLMDKARFAFVSKYRKGASAPDGNTEFQFRAADLNFHSTNYDWLVVIGSDYAKFKGTGTINGEGDFKFQIWAGDGDSDTFRIKIWEEDELGNEILIYDNGMDQEISGGIIVIHAR